MAKGKEHAYSTPIDLNSSVKIIQEVANSSTMREVTSSLCTEDDGDNGHIFEELKLGMQFSLLDELIGFYKRYGKPKGFGVMTQTSERGNDGSMKYVTIGCTCGGKPRNCMLNLAGACPTLKTIYKKKIYTTKIDGVVVDNNSS